MSVNQEENGQDRYRMCGNLCEFQRNAHIVRSDSSGWVVWYQLDVHLDASKQKHVLGLEPWACRKRNKKKKTRLWSLWLQFIFFNFFFAIIIQVKPFTGRNQNRSWLTGLLVKGELEPVPIIRDPSVVLCPHNAEVFTEPSGFFITWLVMCVYDHRGSNRNNEAKRNESQDNSESQFHLLCWFDGFFHWSIPSLNFFSILHGSIWSKTRILNHHMCKNREQEILSLEHEPQGYGKTKKKTSCVRCNWVTFIYKPNDETSQCGNPQLSLTGLLETKS